MNCRHPAIIEKDGVFYCLSCGCALNEETHDKQEGAEEKPVKAAKNAVKRRGKAKPEYRDD
jgi:uncharacterized Zn finger protein (UPF0148 family)